MIRTISNQTGFSLVETLVAVLILLIAVAAPLTIVTRTTQSSAYAIEQATATFLAQEGLELTQQLRDQYYLRYFQALSAGVVTSRQDELKAALDNYASSLDETDITGPGFALDDVYHVPWHLFMLGKDGVNGPMAHCFSGSGCALDPIVVDNLSSGLTILDPVAWPKRCGTAANSCRLAIDASTNSESRFIHSSLVVDEPTIFTRNIRLEESAAGTEVRVIATVTWRTGDFLSESSVVTETAIFNLYDLP